MSDSIDGRSRELLDGKNFAHVVTTSGDGKPHVAVVWADVEGDEILLNGAEDREWSTRLRSRPDVLVTVVNLDDPYEYVTIRGKAVEVTPEGGAAHIDKLAKKYLGKDVYPAHDESVARLLVRIQPEKVRLRGG
ncbi:MAG TPA: TIGR03618 family F420-dependent PPOX class oxidoreductase [Thermoleophilaceae bacterium]|nr:TIGR03618 family F420-dependent PPOX class oxidoreductase [Thermoleophilaceae bacterium]